MKRNIQIFFLFFVLISMAFVAQKLRFEWMPQAHSQTSAGKALPPPTDMPIPPEMMGGTAKPVPPAAAVSAPVPPPPMPQQGLPVDIKGAAVTPAIPPGQDLPPTSLPTPQELDPSLKFLASQEFVYDPTGRRDPFKSYMYIPKKAASVVGNGPVRSVIPSLLQSPDQGTDGLESYDLTDFSVAAILWDVQDPKALLESPSKKMFMVHKHTRLGRNSGYVAAIREGEVVVVEVAPDGKTPSTRVLVLQH